MSRRIRTIKPEILDDDKTAGLSHVAWRLFVSALSLSDDHGNLRAGVTFLMGQVFHSSPATDREDVEGAVDELAEAGLWQVYTVRGQTYAHIRGWSKHQRIDNAGKPKVPGPGEADGTTPTSAEAKNKVRGESPRVAAVRRGSPRFAASRRGSPLEGERETEVDQDQERESAAASARASARPRAYACESAPATSPSARVLAEVVSTEPPPSRTPPLPVQVETASPSHGTGPLASPDAGPESQPPPAVRAPSVPRPEPVPAPAAPVAPPAPPSPPLARTTPAQLPLDDADPADAPAAVALPRVSDLDERTPANRVLRAWGARCYAAAHQPLATEARRRVVRDRLRVFPEADLVRAIDAAMRDPYVNGQSDRAPSGGQRDIAWLFAKVERVERFLAAPAPPPPPAPLPTRLPPARTPPPLPPGAPVLTREEFDAGALQALPPPRRYTVAELEAAAHGATHAR